MQMDLEWTRVTLHKGLPLAKPDYFESFTRSIPTGSTRHSGLDQAIKACSRNAKVEKAEREQGTEAEQGAGEGEDEVQVRLHQRFDWRASLTLVSRSF
jgi:hypothetical protein